MITLYGYASSPNVLKVRILLKEGAIPYEERDVHQERDESCSARFLELSPTGAVPAIEESDTGVELFESSAILLYVEHAGRFYRYTSESLPPDSPLVTATVGSYCISGCLKHCGLESGVLR